MAKRSLMTLILILCMSLTSFAAQNVTGSVYAETANAEDIPIKLISDNKIIDTENIIVNGRTLIPVRKLLESVGATVEWDNPTQRVDLTRNGKKISLHIGSNILITPDGDKEMDIAPILHNGNTTYAPIRAIAEEFGLSVDWDGPTKTILITSPDGCHYVDPYDGITVEQSLELSNKTPEEFNADTGLDYEQYKDKLYIQAENDVAVSLLAKFNNMTFAELKDFMGFEDSVTEDTPWGVAVGSITLRNYFNSVIGLDQYEMTTEQFFEQFRMAFELGNEYTLETKFRFVRTIIDTALYKESKDNAPEPKPQSDIIIPDLTEGHIEMDFLYKLIDKVGNGKLKLEWFTLPPGQISNLGRVENGIYYAMSSNISTVAFGYNIVKVVTVDGAPADEIEAFHQAFREALLANDYTFVKTDEDGYAHYVKGTEEFEIKNSDNKIFYFFGATSYLSCCAKGSNW